MLKHSVSHAAEETHGVADTFPAAHHVKNGKLMQVPHRSPPRHNYLRMRIASRAPNCVSVGLPHKNDCRRHLPSAPCNLLVCTYPRTEPTDYPKYQLKPKFDSATKQTNQTYISIPHEWTKSNYSMTVSFKNAKGL